MAYIYFILYTDDTIKIGCTVDLMGRLLNLVRDIGDAPYSPSRVLGYIEVPDEDKFKEEGNMHFRFRGMRAHNWEYFKNDPNILEYIENFCEKDCERFNEYILHRSKIRRKTRKPQSDRMCRIVCSFTLEQIEFFKTLPKGTVSKFLRRLVDDSEEFQAWSKGRQMP